jgi:hypothetical protein
LVEQAMFFLMGFLVAGLIALLFLPVLARRAMRLSEARARLTAPLSEQQALAERDQLRAEHAVDRRRLEQRMATLEDSVAAHRAELGRRATTIVGLEDLGAERAAEIGAQRAELFRKSEEARGLEAELSSAKIVLYDFAAQLDRASGQIADLRARLLELETAADKHRTIFAGFETRASGLEIELDDSRRDAQAVSRAARSEQTRLSQAVAAQQNENKRLSASLAEAMAKGSILLAEVENKSRQLSETRARLSKAEALLARSERAREDALVEGSRLLQGSGERAPMQREIEHLRSRLAAAESAMRGDAELRQAISRLAMDVARVGAPADEEAAPISNLLNFELREPSLALEFGDDGPKASTIIKLRQTQPRAPDR